MNKRLEAKLKKLYEDSKTSSAYGKIPDGTSVWRFVPYKYDADGDPAWFFIRRSHYLGKELGTFGCLREFDDTCPICDWRDKHQDSESEIRRAVASAFYPRVEYMVNAIRLKSEDGKLIPDKTPIVLTLPKVVYDAVLEQMVNNGRLDLCDPERGSALTIVKEKTGPLPINVKYKLMVRDKRGPIFKNPETLKQVLAKVKNFEKKGSHRPELNEVETALKLVLKDKKFKIDAQSNYLERQQSRKNRD